MGEGTIILIVKFGGYALIARAITKLAKAIYDLKNMEDDQDPELNQIVKKPRLRR